MSKAGKRFAMVAAASLLVGLIFGAGWVMGQQAAKTEPTLLHVFAYTPVEGATQQDFDDFRRATSDMIGKVPGLKKAWVGKLKSPLDLGSVAPKREYGVAMEFADTKALDAYADDPAHTTWEKVYRKVRVAGTTTFDILGE